MPLYWLWFANLPNIPLWQKKAILERFPDPEEIYFAPAEAFEEIPDFTQEMQAALACKDLQECEQIAAQCRKKNIAILPFGDEQYPERLRNIEDPPVVLYYRGLLPDWDERPYIGVVGTRKATSYGLQQARIMGSQIALCGGMVVSGGATGIDSASMTGAMDAGSAVVGVLGGGVDVIYPRTNRRLFTQVVEKGCLLSEYPPGAAPLGWHFLQRNRIISGLCHGILVVEAPERSGALSTARHAARQGRDIYALPANVGIAAYAGNNGLLQQGYPAALNGWDTVKAYAHLYPETVANNCQILGSAQEKTTLKVAQNPVIPEKSQKLSIDNPEKSSYSVLIDGTSSLQEEEKEILSLLTRHPVHSDTVAENSTLPPQKVQSILTKLTLQGLVEHYPGGRVSLK